MRLLVITLQDSKVSLVINMQTDTKMCVNNFLCVCVRVIGGGKDALFVQQK